MLVASQQVAQNRPEPSYYTLPDFFRILKMSARKGSGKKIGEHVSRPAEVFMCQLIGPR